MNLEHQPIVAPQESSTRQVRTAAQKKKDSRQQAVTAANIYTWENVKARGAFEAAYEKHAMEVNERRHRENPSGRWTGMKADDQRDLVEHAAKYLQKLFKDDQIPPGLKRRPTQGVSLGGAGGSDNSHVQGSAAKQTFQTTINPKEGRRLEDILDRYPPGYNSEGGSGFSGMSSPETKSPSASELESDKRKDKGKAKATHSSPNYRAHESSPSDNEYHPGDFLTEEADRTERRERARVAERNQEAARMQIEAARQQQPYIQSSLQPQQARVATKPVPSTTSKSTATGDTRVAAGKQPAAKTNNSAIPREKKSKAESNREQYYLRMGTDIANQNPWPHPDYKENFARAYKEEAIKEENNQKGETVIGRRVPWKQENHDRILDRLRRRPELRIDPNNFVSITVDYRGNRIGYATRPVRNANPNNYPTVKAYPLGYDSSGSSNPPDTPPITKSPGGANPSRTPPIMNSPSLSVSRLFLNDDLYADPSPMRSKEQSSAPRSGGTSPHVANQSPASRGTGNDQRSRATSKTSSKGSSDSNAFMADVFDFAAASTHTPPRSTDAPQPVPTSRAQHVGPSTHVTAGKTSTTAGKTPASQKTVGASKRPTESSASSSKAKGDKDKNSLKGSASSSGRKEDKGKGPAKKK
ncbi:unnamed protein product [Alternaria burnsii]|nr:unnamed protein product [Alternaria burnsii]